MGYLAPSHLAGAELCPRRGETGRGATTDGRPGEGYLRKKGEPQLIDALFNMGPATLMMEPPRHNLTTSRTPLAAHPQEPMDGVTREPAYNVSFKPSKPCFVRRPENAAQQRARLPTKVRPPPHIQPHRTTATAAVAAATTTTAPTHPAATHRATRVNGVLGQPDGHARAPPPPRSRSCATWRASVAASGH